jgi:hypothetical protein
MKQMQNDKGHLVVRDATLTFAHILKTYVPPLLEQTRPVDVMFELPDEKTLAKAKQEGRAILSCILIDVNKSSIVQTTQTPIVREEDEDGNVVELRMGPPHFVMPRYLITPWSGNPLVDQELIGLTIRIMVNRASFQPEDIQGSSIPGESKPMLLVVDTFDLNKQLQLWEQLGAKYRPSVICAVNLRMESLTRNVMRRVKERILDYKKIEG